MQTSMSMRLPKRLNMQLGELAKATGRTKSYLAVQALKKFVEKESWQVAEIKEALKEADAGQFVEENEMQIFWDKWTK